MAGASRAVHGHVEVRRGGERGGKRAWRRGRVRRLRDDCGESKQQEQQDRAEGQRKGLEMHGCGVFVSVEGKGWLWNGAQVVDDDDGDEMKIEEEMRRRQSMYIDSIIAMRWFRGGKCFEK